MSSLRTLLDIVNDPDVHPFYKDLIAKDPELSAELRRELRAYAPPDPYAKDLAALKAASAATDAETFEDAWKKRRMLELNAEYRRFRGHIDANPTPRAAEGKSYAPPDPYEADIKRLRERDARALVAKEKRR
jgi:hypothetical protein